MDSAFAPDLWILVTLAAAVFQTGRFMLQKHLATDTLSAGGATFSRFLYSAPFVALLLPLYLALSGQGVPPLEAGFWLYGAMGGTAQLKWASRAQANALEFAMVSDEALRAVVAEARLAASEDLGAQSTTAPCELSEPADLS